MLWLISEIIPVAMRLTLGNGRARQDISTCEVKYFIFTHSMPCLLTDLINFLCTLGVMDITKAGSKELVLFTSLL